MSTPSIRECRLRTADELAHEICSRTDTTGARTRRPELFDQVQALYRRAAAYDEMAAMELRGVIRGLYLAGALWEHAPTRFIERLSLFMCGRLKT